MCQEIAAVVNIERILYRRPFSPNKSMLGFCHLIVSSEIVVLKRLTCLNMLCRCGLGGKGKEKDGEGERDTQTK